MSRDSSTIDQLRRVPTGGPYVDEHHIALVDTEKAPSDAPSAEATDNEAGPSDDGPDLLRQPTASSLLKTLTDTSALREQARKRKASYKYSKYRKDRYEENVEAPPADQQSPPEASNDGGERAPAVQKRYLERGMAVAHQAGQMLRRKRALQGASDEDAAIDILYENQRGAFLFGIPKFSSSSLLNFDPKPWQNAQLRTSPVDIRNAQVPDPSWDWAWTCWYVDMSRDVDEQGWEYSFMFQKNFNWHGNHPWFHSFVRRRRWLRKRVRRDVHLHMTREKAHELTSDYFTIHPRTLRSTSREGTLQTGIQARIRELASMEDEIDVEEMEMATIADLMHALRKGHIDREKLGAVRKFVSSGGDDLYYLAEKMGDIMALFVFQSSRRHLLADLLRHFDEAKSRKASLAEHSHGGDDEAKLQHERAERQADNLLNAVRAAEEKVKTLEYWSDVKSMVNQGQALTPTDETNDKVWDMDRWQGLVGPSQPGHDLESFRSKQDAGQGTQELQKHPEHSTDEQGEDDTGDDDSTIKGGSGEDTTGSADVGDPEEEHTASASDGAGDTTTAGADSDNIGTLDTFATADEHPRSEDRASHDSDVANDASELNTVPEEEKVVDEPEVQDEGLTVVAPIPKMEEEEAAAAAVTERQADAERGQ